MASSKTGAILVLERNNSLDFIKSSGDQMNIEINQPIIESIFYKNSPLHDGAAVIVDNYIVATRVILPVSNERNIPLRFGLRHRAAVGITEKTDALCIVVSEETGLISYIKNGEFVLYNSLNQLGTMLKQDLVPNQSSKNESILRQTIGIPILPSPQQNHSQPTLSKMIAKNDSTV